MTQTTQKRMMALYGQKTGGCDEYAVAPLHHMTRGLPRISTVYALGPREKPDQETQQEQNHAAFAAAWHKKGIAALRPDDIQDDWIRQAIINEADKLYGKRTK